MHGEGFENNRFMCHEKIRRFSCVRAENDTFFLVSRAGVGAAWSHPFSLEMDLEPRTLGWSQSRLRNLGLLVLKSVAPIKVAAP